MVVDVSFVALRQQVSSLRHITQTMEHVLDEEQATCSHIVGVVSNEGECADWMTAQQVATSVIFAQP